MFENKKNFIKKTQKTKIEEPILKLEDESIDEDPLILEDAHTESKLTIKETPVATKETKISPAARKMATESNVDLDKIEGTGKNGVILRGYNEFDGFKTFSIREKNKTRSRRKSKNDEIAVNNS